MTASAKGADPMLTYAAKEEKQKSPQAQAARANPTGIPDPVKSRFEALSGFSFDDVKVHYNSGRPAQLRALAYTQGNDVYIGPGQEKHLHHELGHVIQQKRGQVSPTLRAGGVNINADPMLEREADTLSRRPSPAKIGLSAARPAVIQRMVGMEFQCMGTSPSIILEATGTACNHGVELMDRTGYKITGDMGDFEFVTKAVDERNDGQIRVLRDACKDAGNFFIKVIENLGCAGDSARDATYKKGTGTLSAYSFKKNATTAHPQATVGVKLEKLDDFITEYANAAKKAEGNLGRKIDKPSTAATPLKSSLYLPFGGSKEDLKDAQKAILSDRGELGVRLPKEGDMPKDVAWSAQAQGLARLLRIMNRSAEAYKARPGGHPNAKSGMPIMPRTALRDAYMLLSHDEQYCIKHCHEDWLKYIFGKVGAGDGSDILLAHQGGADFTYKEWAEALLLLDAPASATAAMPKDALSAAGYSGVGQISNPIDANTKTKFGIGSSTQIYPGGPGKEKDKAIAGLILELRGLQRNVQPSDWEFVARDVALLVRYVNAGSP